MPSFHSAGRAVTLSALLVLTGCQAAVPAAAPAAAVPSGIETCVPGDQDAYAYRPARLQVLAPCARATGVVVASSAEADGDVHINVRLDPPFSALLRPGNDFEDGLLIVEPVCQFAPLQADAIRVCASDPGPLAGGLPAIGEHVSLEGRYVLDLQHHAWAELHPLYRWAKVTP